MAPTPDLTPDLTPDCTACAALCCLALAFDEGEDFAIDKPAGLPCPNLASDLGCTIYNRLEGEGFRGCASYDCKGAGQRVVQELFAGQDWAKHPELAEDMISAFAAMRQVHDGIELLTTAGALELPGVLEAERQALLQSYTPAGWSLERLLAFPTSSAPLRLRGFLPRLADWV